MKKLTNSLKIWHNCAGMLRCFLLLSCVCALHAGRVGADDVQFNTQLDSDIIRETAAAAEKEEARNAALREVNSAGADEDDMLHDDSYFSYNFEQPITIDTWVGNTDLSCVDIIAVVGDSVVTSADIILRSRVITEGRYDTLSADSQKAVKHAALEALIDEFVILSVARQNKSPVAEEEVIAHIKQIDPEMEHFKKMQALGIPDAHIYDMVRGEILWQAVASREISALQKRQPLLPKQPGQEEILLEEISVSKIGSAEGFSKNIHNALAEGVKFAQLATNISHSPSTLQHGSIGWIITRSLDPAIRKHIQGMEKGDFSPVIETPHHYIIYHLVDRRIQSETRSWLYTTTHMSVKLSDNDKERDQQLERLNVVHINCGTSQDLKKLAEQVKNASLSVHNKAPLDSLHPALQKALVDLPEGAFSSVIVLDNEAHILRLDKKEAAQEGCQSLEGYRQIVDIHAILKQKKSFMRGNVSVDIVIEDWAG